MCTHKKKSHLKVLQRTAPSELGTLESAFYTTFLFLWLLNKLQSAVVEGSQTTRFLTNMNNSISYMKRLQRTTSSKLGALASK